MLNPFDNAFQLLKTNDPHEDDYAIEDDPDGEFSYNEVSNQTFDNRYINELMRQMRDDGKRHNRIRYDMSSGQKAADTMKRNKMLEEN